jgi:thiamine-phosphate pyrophosphorylase
MMAERRETEPNGQAGSGCDAAAWRAFDAVGNRAVEAIRVLEDVVRFMLDDRGLAAEAKQLRHDLAGLLDRIGRPRGVLARDVAGDVGTDLSSRDPLGRRSASDLVAANAARGGQAIRSLSEISAVVAPEWTSAFDPLRYRLYALERNAAIAIRSVSRLEGVSLCVLVDGRGSEPAFCGIVEGLLAAGVRMFQVRDKVLDTADLVGRARLAVSLARPRGAVVIVNDRVDVAIAAGADGAHVGEADLPTRDARRLLGPDRLLGRTAHSMAELRAAVADGADYLGIGPCYASRTKAFGAFADSAFLEEAAQETSLPVFAIGGITRDRVADLAAMGLHRVAVASAVTDAADPATAARSLLERLA